MKRFKLKVNVSEYTIIIKVLNDFRNKNIAKGRYVDSIDELLIKLNK